jgi:hypothetical protein
MRFVRTEMLSGELRGTHIADKLGVPCGTEVGDAQPGEFVVFVKTLKGAQEAKASGCMVAFDPVDLFCYGRSVFESVPFVDLLIVPAKSVAGFYKAVFPHADFLVIPHQWDSRIVGEAVHDRFRPGYIGRDFNLTEDLRIEMVTQEDEQLHAMHRFNAHVVQYSDALKPATKVSCAAAVGAIAVVTKTQPAVELLGESYPFYATGTLFDAL